MKPVAFFDIDGTLFRSSLLIELVNQLIKSEVFPIDTSQNFKSQFEAWQKRQGTYQQYIDAVVETFMENIKGVNYGEFADIGRIVVAKQSQYVYRYTRDLISSLKNDGYHLVAISQSPKTILDEFCRQYGFDKVYGRIYEIGPQDAFTGLVTNKHLIENKANIVRRVFEKDSELTRDKSIAVGDTEGDISLLDMASEPICFNPNKALYNHARRNGWTVVVERKDMIYHI
jgi:HAD superfamily hydrolase (TIGR01490 family)